MAFTSETQFPTLEELTVNDIKLTSGPLMAAAKHLGKYCDEQCKEFMLCYYETYKNPNTCLKEGKDVTSCGVDFFQKVKQNCANEFADYHFCLDKRSNIYNDLAKCRETQFVFDDCMKQKLEVDRPEFGHFSKTRLHSTERPRYELTAAPMPEEIPDSPDYRNAPPPKNLDWLMYALKQVNPTR